MRYAKLRMILLTVCLLVCPLSAQSQTAPAETIEQLVQGIRNLEAVDRDPNTPDEIRRTNQEFLTEKRTKLRALLERSKNDWKSYLSNNANSLSPDQVGRVENKIKVLDDQINRLTNSTSNAAPTSSGSTGEESGSTTEISNAPNAQSTRPNGTGNQGAPPTTSSGQTGTTAEPGNRPLFEATTNGQFSAALGYTANRIRQARAADSSATFDPRRDFNLLALALVVRKTQPGFVADAENARTDKQTGGSESSGGTTSLVSKGGVPAVLGFAVENGALTQSTSQTTVTFRGNLVGIYEALAKKGFIDGYKSDDSLTRFLRNVSFGVSFDTSRGVTPGTLTGDKQQLSGYSVRYNIINNRDPRDKRYTTDWNRLVGDRSIGVSVARDLGLVARQLLDRKNIPPVLDKWLTETQEAVAKASAGNINSVLETQIDKIPVTDLPPQLSEAVTASAKDFESYLKGRDDIINRIAKGLVITFDYVNDRPLNLPSTSNFKFIAEKGTSGGGLDLTFNGSFTLLNSIPNGSKMDQLRDFRLASQFDVPLGSISGGGKFLLSFAGRYERLMNDQKTASGAILVPKGDIAVGQAKLTIPIRGTAFKIPLSISFANRTELIKEKHVRGNFGITFDLDSILAKFNPFSQK